MKVKAKAKFIKMSPRKVRLVVDAIRGLDVVEALISLKFSKKDAAKPLIKLINSAVSNGEENDKLKRDNLFIKEIIVDEGPTTKRWRPRAFGRATPIRKRSSHITLVLEEKIPTIVKEKTKKKEDEKDDIIKIEDLDELKSIDKEEIKEEKTAEKKEKQVSAPTKGFVGKIFNRKSGQK